MEHLDARLGTIAAMTPRCRTVADIGCDHGLLIAALLESGRCDYGIAADINARPLEKARRLLAERGLLAQSECRLTNGLCGIAPVGVDTIVIAGMGGETIIHILSQAPWTKNGDTMLLLQPMTKQEELRRWLNENGYAQYAERLVRDKNYLYPVFTVCGGAQTALSVGEIYGGLDIEVDPVAGEYLAQRIRRLTQAVDGLLKGGSADNARRAQELGEIITALKERRDAL